MKKIILSDGTVREYGKFRPPEIGHPELGQEEVLLEPEYPKLDAAPDPAKVEPGTIAMFNFQEDAKAWAREVRTKTTFRVHTHPAGRVWYSKVGPPRIIRRWKRKRKHH